MNLVRGAWQIVKENRRPYVVLNVAYYGLVALGMVYVGLVNPALQERLMADIAGSFTAGPLSAVGGAYLGGNVLTAAVLTFAVNLLAGSLLMITVPSLILPFAGVATGIYRAVLWGLILAPTSTELALVMIPHSLTLVLEGQAYILAMLAAYVHGKCFVRPGSVGLTSRAAGYMAGLRLSARVYILVVICLALAAVYEAVSVVTMVRLASGGP